MGWGQVLEAGPWVLPPAGVREADSYRGREKVAARTLERHLERMDLSEPCCGPFQVFEVPATPPFGKPWEDPHTPSAAWRRRLLLPGAVVWACLRFCSPELRFISLKHPLARHSAICSVLPSDSSRRMFL